VYAEIYVNFGITQTKLFVNTGLVRGLAIIPFATYMIKLYNIKFKHANLGHGALLCVQC